MTPVDISKASVVNAVALSLPELAVSIFFVAVIDIVNAEWGAAESTFGTVTFKAFSLSGRMGREPLELVSFLQPLADAKPPSM